MGPGSGDQVLDESGGLKKVKVGMRFNYFYKRPWISFGRP